MRAMSSIVRESPVRTTVPAATCAVMPSVLITSPWIATWPDGIVITGMPGRAKRTPESVRQLHSRALRWLRERLSALGRPLEAESALA